MIVVKPCRAASATSATLICGAVEKSSVTRRKSDMRLRGEVGKALRLTSSGADGSFATSGPRKPPRGGVTPVMLRFIGRRFLVAIPTLFVVITLAFFMMRAAPGGPFDIDRKLSP